MADQEADGADRGEVEAVPLHRHLVHVEGSGHQTTGSSITPPVCSQYGDDDNFIVLYKGCSNSIEQIRFTMIKYSTCEWWTRGSPRCTREFKWN